MTSHRVDARRVLKDIETHSLGERTALPNGHDVPLLHVLPAGRAVHRHVLVSLLVTSLEEDRATKHRPRR